MVRIKDTTRTTTTPHRRCVPHITTPTNGVRLPRDQRITVTLRVADTDCFSLSNFAASFPAFKYHSCAFRLSGQFLEDPNQFELTVVTSRPCSPHRMSTTVGAMALLYNSMVTLAPVSPQLFNQLTTTLMNPINDNA